MKVLSIDRVRFGAFEFDRLNRLLYREGAELSLPPRAIAVLASLIDRPGQIVSKQVLLDEVWKDANVTETSLTEAVSLLRQALADDPQRPAFIQTVPRRGYRFVAPAEFVDGNTDGIVPTARPIGAAASSAARERLGASDGAAIGNGSVARSWPTDRDSRDVAPLTAAAAEALPAAIAAPPGASGASAVRPAVALAPDATLDVAVRETRSAVALAPSSAEETWPAWLPWLFLGVTLVVATGILMPLVQRPSTYARPVVRFAVDVPAGLRLVGDGPAIAVSRDGRRVAFVARRGDGPARVYVRDMDRLDPVVLEGTDGAAAPFFSPDARWVGFFAGGSLKKVPAEGPVGGGAPVTLAAARMPLGAVWSTRRFIVFASSLTGGLSRVHEDGGRVITLTTPDPDEGEVRHAWPDMLPDDGGVVFTGIPLTGGPEASRIAVFTFDNDRVQTLVSAGVSPHYVPTGHLLFARNRTVFAAPFDPDARELLGPALPVLDDVVTDDRSGAAQFAVAPGGHTAALRLTRAETAGVYQWLPLGLPPGLSLGSPPGPPRDTDARPASFTAPFPAREIRGASLSPDGTRLAVSLGDGHRTDIWVSNIPRGDLRRLTTDGQNVSPIWADSRRIVYASRRGDGPFALFVHAIDDPAASAVALDVDARQAVPVSASPAGLVYVDAQPATGLDLWLLPWSGGRAQPIVRTPFDETAGTISPDGRWLAFQSNESGEWMVMLRPLSAAGVTPEATGGATRIAASDGSRIAWSPDGQSLLFTHDGRLQQVALAGTPPRPAGPPRTLATDTDAADGFGVTQNTLGSDPIARNAVDRVPQVLVRTRDASAAPARLEVVLDWSRELSARVPIRPRPPKPVR